MSPQNALEKLEKLFGTWGLKRDDWILVANYALKLQGYRVKLRRGHFNTMVNKGKLPWRVKEGYEVLPPRSSVWASALNEWMKQTKFDTDLIAYDSKKIRKYLRYSSLYKLPNRKPIRLITMTGNLVSLGDFLSHCREKEAGIEKGIYLLKVIENCQKAAELKKDRKAVSSAQKILKKYEFLKLTRQGKLRIFDNEIKGMGIYCGKVTGRVKLIKRRGGKIPIMKWSEILVTKMTSPDFIIAAHKIRGIVTDEGGRLCHAAILAREYKIPCVIGTRTATKILKDGDLIEVDADCGVVKLLKRKG